MKHRPSPPFHCCQQEHSAIDATQTQQGETRPLLDKLCRLRVNIWLMSIGRELLNKCYFSRTKMKRIQPAGTRSLKGFLNLLLSDMESIRTTEDGISKHSSAKLIAKYPFKKNQTANHMCEANMLTEHIFIEQSRLTSARRSHRTPCTP